MELKQWHGFCLCPLGGACPPDAVPADAPFSPLVFLVRRDPLRSRGLFAVTVLDEVFEAETAGVLLPPAQGTHASRFPAGIRTLTPSAGRSPA